MLKSVLITGANGGLGKETARQLALQDGIERLRLQKRRESEGCQTRVGGVDWQISFRNCSYGYF